MQLSGKRVGPLLAYRAAKRDLEKELNVLNTIVLEETSCFFQRVLDSEAKPDNHDEAAAG